jgi:hypothetical protein
VSTGVLFNLLVVSPVLTSVQALCSGYSIRRLEVLLKEKHGDFLGFYKGEEGSFNQKRASGC